MRLHSAFEQQKGSGLVLFCFGAIAAAAMAPKPKKKRVRIHFMKTWYGRFTLQKYLVCTNFFMSPDLFFTVV